MGSLKDFAFFLKQNKLEELALAELENLRAFNLPLLNQFAEIEEKDLVQSTRESLDKFLLGLQDGTALDLMNKNLLNLENDHIAGVSKTAISLSDFVRRLTAQKVSLVALLPLYTQETSIAVKIILELENHYWQ